MKIILAQINVTVGNFEENFQKIKQEINQAKLQAADLIIFPEELMRPGMKYQTIGKNILIL